jgi:glycerol-3-phosphate acyltransferase PlsX
MNRSRQRTAESPYAAKILKAPMARVLKAYDHEEYGGALLLGLQELLLKVHGSGGPRAIKNAVRNAKAAGKLDVNRMIGERVGSANLSTQTG